MYIPLNKNGAGIELFSYLDEWSDNCFTEHGIAGFDIMIKIGYPLHLFAFVVARDHIAICILNFEFALFFKN